MMMMMTKMMWMITVKERLTYSTVWSSKSWSAFALKEVDVILTFSTIVAEEKRAEIVIYLNRS